MRPLRLELRGFTAFRHAAVVDFSGRTLFAITGPTGAGKSSLLDAMTWALYGQVPRVGRSTHQLVTHGEKSMAVRFDFSARGHTYRVTRTTAGAIGTRLEQAVEGERDQWRLLADRAPDVTKRVGALVGLDYATFTRTIVLPQGEFGAFLRGEERERRDILSTLLGLEAYEGVGRAARGRAREALTAQTLQSRQLERLTLATPEAQAALGAEQAAMETRHATSEAMRASLAALAITGEAHAVSLRAVDEASRGARAAQLACSEAEQALAAATAATAAALEAQARLVEQQAMLGYDAEAHRRLREAAQLLEAREAAARALAGAREAEQAAAAQVQAATGTLATAERDQRVRAAAAETTAQALQRATAVLREAITHTSGLARALAAAEVETETAAVVADGEAGRRTREADQLAAFARGAADLEAEEARAVGALTSARLAAAAAREEERRNALEAERAGAAATHARSHLDASRAEHAAAAIRAGLAPGDPCPVCGTHVTQLLLHAVPDLAAAEAAVTAAETILRTALQAQRAAASGAASAEAHLAALEGEASRRAVRRDSLAASLATLAVAPEAQRAGALTRLAEAAREAADAAGRVAPERRATLEGLRRARHALDLRVAEASARLDDFAPTEQPAVGPCADLEQARDATRALTAAVTAHTAAAAAATDASEGHRAATALVARAEESLGGAQSTLAERTAATASAVRQLAALPQLDVSTAPGGDVRAALAAAAALAATAADLEARARTASTQAAVLREREEQRALQSRQRRAEAETAAAALEARAQAAADSAAEFAAQWRSLLGTTRTPDLAALRQLTQDVEEDARAIAQARGALRERLDRAWAEAAEAAQLRTEIEAAAAIGRVAGALERELHADRFIAYVQREALAILAADASSRLLHLTGGRYRLVGEADEFYVIDHLNGDERRSVRTLSGGETFLASLALALALSERLPELAGAGGALSLESLFLDEGFGSLDAASLDVAIEGLERLAGGRRLIGVISHVPEIAERLPDRIDVLKAPEGSSIATG